MQRSTLLLLGLSVLCLRLDAQILRARPLATPVDLKPASGAAAANPGTPAAVAPAAISRRETVWDSAPLTKLVVTFARGVAIETNIERMADWRYGETPDFAATWTNQLVPTVRMGINYYSGPAARSLMAGTAWASVSATLRRDPKDATRVLVNDDSQANTAMIRPLGMRTRVYEWETVPAVPNAPVFRQLLVAVGDDNQAYLFALEGPAIQMQPAQPTFKNVVSSFDPVQAGGGR